MLIYLDYARNRKQWNIRFLLLLGICLMAWGLIGFRSSPKPSVFVPASEEDLPDSSSGQIKVLTYNIAGLPEWISSAATPRAFSIEEIGRKINVFDIVNVQEDFNYNKYLYALNTHPYRTVNKGGVPFGDGLSTLSRYPILDFKRVAWEHCNGADCLAQKGFTYARIGLAKGVSLDVYNVHATAQDDRGATEARRENLKQLTRFILENSSCQALLLMGDFNAHYAYTEDNIKTFQEQVSALDTWVALKNDGFFPTANPTFHAQHALTVTDDRESIDKIYFRNSDHFVFTPKKYTVESSLFQYTDGQPLSDHHAVSVVLEWTVPIVKEPTPPDLSANMDNTF